MKLSNFLKVSAIALLFSMTLASCKKDNPTSSNEMSYNNRIENISFVDLSFFGNSGCSFALSSDKTEIILTVVLAPSLIGTKIDLSQPCPSDIFSSAYYIATDTNEDVETWTDDFVYIYGDDGDYPVYADKGSYLLVKKISETEYSIEIYATKDGYTLKVNYSGPVRVHKYGED